ncbi:MAG: Galactosyltransferase-related protein [Ignavibacteriae bacterium]|nr:MAG: Galactosyltransferase-related protein [Ignavibacteriota bacterium]
MGRKEVIDNWKKYWLNENNLAGKHTGLSPIFIELKNILGDFNGKKFLECGSGVSEISIDIAKNGGQVYLLDISMEALKISKSYFNRNHLMANHICASMFQIPFANASFDVVWNAGVLEHYHFEDQVLGLKEMSRVCKKNGIIITFNPYKYGVFYRLGKFFAEKKKEWVFGEEHPVISLKEHAVKLNLKLVDEYYFNFEHQITFLKYLNKLIFYIVKSLYLITPQLLKNLWLKIFKGYLLVSIFKKIE